MLPEYAFQADAQFTIYPVNDIVDKFVLTDTLANAVTSQVEKLCKSEEVQTTDQVENLDNVGVPEERIKRMGEDDNFWMNGVTGPCGACSEIYYDFHPDKGYANADFGDGSRFIELYNLVFMQYNKKDDGSLEPLKQKNIDTGMGLERMAQVLQKVPNNYETDLIFLIIEKASNWAMISYANADDVTKANVRIIGDHMLAVGYLISDGVVPSNLGRGYVVRRLIRRVVRTDKLLGIKGYVEGNIEGAFLPTLARTAIDLSTSDRATILVGVSFYEVNASQPRENDAVVLRPDAEPGGPEQAGPDPPGPRPIKPK